VLSVDCARHQASSRILTTELRPSLLLVHPAARLFFLVLQDHLNHLLRRISISTAVVTTVAGTAGVSGSADGVETAALFYFPTGIAMDAAGTVVLVVSSTVALETIAILPLRQVLLCRRRNQGLA